jgi:phosphoribosylformylglycinamidine synthase PurS subunit
MYNVKVYVTLKKSIADPQGNAIKNALLSMGYNGVEDVRMGKMIEVRLDGLSRSQIEESVEGMCQRLLANTVIEDYSFEITEV